MREETMNKKPVNPDQLRAAAEAELSHLPVKASQARPAEKLLHELQVYQIELEMQNEQLREAQAALEESRDRYVDLYEFAPVGYLTLARDGTISEVNLTGARLLGVERKKLLHRRLSSFVVPEQQDRWNRLIANTLPQCEATSCELTLKKGDGEYFRALLDCLCLEPKGGLKAVRIAFTDITRQILAEESLREWQQFAEYASWGMAIGDVENKTLKRVNPAFAKMHGYTEEEMLGMKSIDLFSPENRADFVQYYESMLTAGFHALETVRLRKDGSTFPAIIDASIVKSFNGAANYIVSVKDITESRANERQRRELTAHIQTIREEEKANIAREIHDDLGGTLTALKMEAYWLAEELSVNKEAEPFLKHVELITQLTDNAVNVTRRVITGLRPTILDDLGLLAALEWQAGQFYNHTGISCRVNSIEDKAKLGKHHSIALFRIFQETLTNVARHSGASKVEVEFRCGDEEVMLSVSDDGRGLPEGHSVSPTSYGVRGMCERVEQLDGKIKFDSPSGGGFSVTVLLPLHVNNITESQA
jgi:PAS domain S-box-containing protein